MRTISFTTRFKRDYKREKAGRHRQTIEADLKAALDLLVENRTLPRRYVDHALSGEWRDHRYCHLRPDLVLISDCLTRTNFNSSGLARIAS
jgi:mRNA interferase YafQ